MFGVPFREFFSLIPFDDDFDLPKHRFAPLADRSTQLCDGVGGIEVENTQKILMLKVIFRLQAAAGHKGKGDADGGGVSELLSDVKRIILLQKTSVNDVEQIVLMVVPVVRRKLTGDFFKLVGKAVLAGNAVPFRQCRGHRRLMLRAVLPQPGAAGVLLLAGVRHIKDIAHLVFPGAGVDEGDTPGSLHHIPAHLLTPQFIAGTGGCIRALGVDHQLFPVGVFVDTAHHSQKAGPLLVAAGDLMGGVVGKFQICQGLIRHRQHPPGQCRG